MATRATLKALAEANIKSGNRVITPAKHRSVIDDILDAVLLEDENATNTDITDGTSTDLKRYTPAQLKLAAQTHGPGGGALDDLTDVSISSVNDNDVLSYDGGSGDWVNSTPANIVIAKTATSVSTPPNSTTETEIFGFNVTGGDLAADGDRVEISSQGFIFNNASTGDFIFRLKIGGTTVIQANTRNFSTNAAAKPYSLKVDIWRTDSGTNAYCQARLEVAAATSGVSPGGGRWSANGDTTGAVADTGSLPGPVVDWTSTQAISLTIQNDVTDANFYWVQAVADAKILS